MQQFLLNDKTLLGVCVVGVFVLGKLHQAAVDALPEPERDIVRELLRHEVFAFGLYLLVIGFEITRHVTDLRGTAVMAAPACIGLVAGLALFFIRSRAYRIYAFFEEEHERGRAVRARRLQLRAGVHFVASTTLWLGLLIHRV